MLPFSFINYIAYEIPLFLDAINPLHAVYSLYTSLPLAHKLIICFIQPLYESVSNT